MHRCMVFSGGPVKCGLTVGQVAPSAQLTVSRSRYRTHISPPRSLLTFIHSQCSLPLPQANLLTNIFRRNSNIERELFYVMCSRMAQTQAYKNELEVDDGDTGSIETFSTNATVDDNPGTGRVLDKYFYQPAGRRIERLALRFTIRYLHPWRISEFLSALRGIGLSEPQQTLDESLRHFSRLGSIGSTVVSGLKSLVRQAQWVKVWLVRAT